MSLLLQHGRHRGNATLEAPPEDPQLLDFFIHSETNVVYAYVPIKWSLLETLAFAAAAKTPVEGKWVNFGGGTTTV